MYQKRIISRKHLIIWHVILTCTVFHPFIDIGRLDDSSFWVPLVDALWLEPAEVVLLPDEWRCLFGRISVFLKEVGIEEWGGKLRLPGVPEWLCEVGGVDPKECRFLFVGGSLGDDVWEDREMELEDRWLRNVTAGSWFGVVPIAFDEEFLLLLLPLKTTKRIASFDEIRSIFCIKIPGTQWFEHYRIKWICNQNTNKWSLHYYCIIIHNDVLFFYKKTRDVLPDQKQKSLYT